MEIFSIKHGMDGRYTCIFDTDKNDTAFLNRNNNTINAFRSRRSFFIPYIISHVNFPESVILSFAISIAFCVLCAIIICADCYSARRRNNDDDVNIIGYSVYKSNLSVGSSTDQFLNIRRKTQVHHSSIWEPWNITDEDSSQISNYDSAENNKNFTRTFSTIGFDEILPPCIEKSEETSAVTSNTSSPQTPLRMHTIAATKTKEINRSCSNSSIDSSKK